MLFRLSSFELQGSLEANQTVPSMTESAMRGSCPSKTNCLPLPMCQLNCSAVVSCVVCALRHMLSICPGQGQDWTSQAGLNSEITLEYCSAMHSISVAEKSMWTTFLREEEVWQLQAITWVEVRMLSAPHAVLCYEMSGVSFLCWRKAVIWRRLTAYLVT